MRHLNVLLKMKNLPNNVKQMLKNVLKHRRKGSIVLKISPLMPKSHLNCGKGKTRHFNVPLKIQFSPNNDVS